MSDARELIDMYGPDFADIIPNLGNDMNEFNTPEMLAYEAKLQAELDAVVQKLKEEGWKP